MNAERFIFRITFLCIAFFIFVILALTLLEFFTSHPEILIAIGYILLIGFLVYLFLVRPRHRTRTHGSARFALAREIRKARLFYPRLFGKQKHWLRLGKYRTRVIALPEQIQQAHTLMLAQGKVPASSFPISCKSEAHEAC